MKQGPEQQLQIDEIPLANGSLGLSRCPGLAPDTVLTAEQALAVDLAAIRAWGADFVLSLVEEADLVGFTVADLHKGAEDAGLTFLHLPISDMGLPDQGTLAAWQRLSPRLHRVLEQGGRVLIHCRAGLGRSGTLAALMLVERGMSGRDAIDAVRRARPGALETTGQEDWILAQCLRQDAAATRMLACLLGGAMGDSLGADIEFQSLEEIRKRFPEGLTDLPPHDRLRGAITDDTQMTLFTAEGLLDAMRASGTADAGTVLACVHAALLRWLTTQGGAASPDVDKGRLALDRRLHASRAPGATCLSALAAQTSVPRAARNASKGCGTIMRVAPVALMVPRASVRQVAMETSALTHGHPTGQLAAAAWAELLAAVAAGEELEQAARALTLVYAELPDGRETATAMERALVAPRDGRPETVESVGAGWIAEEALAVALYACLCAGSVEDRLRIAVLHSGDSDSTGAIAGNMLGLLHPDEVLAHRWAGTIECVDQITWLCRRVRDLGPAPRERVPD